MEITLGNRTIVLVDMNDNCSSCHMPEGYDVSFKSIFFAAYHKVYKNKDYKPSKTDTYEYVLDNVDIDNTESPILCKDCIKQTYKQIVEILEDYEE